MKRALLAALLLIPLAGCAHQQDAYAPGAAGFFYGDCLDDYDYGCGYGPYRRYDYTYENLSGGPAVPERARVTKIDRRGTTHTVKREQASPPSSNRTASRGVTARNASTMVSRSAPAASFSHSAPAASSSHSSSQSSSHR
jgi:hypothetical protein